MILPDILPYDNYNGDFKSFYEDVYKIFKNDFVDNRLHYKGRRLGLKKHPLIDGKEYTLYPFISSSFIFRYFLMFIIRMD